MTEQQILADLLEWVKVHHPDYLQAYRSVGDQKAAAQDLLRLRIKDESGYLFALPVSLLRKLEYHVVIPEIDSTLLGLCAATRTKIAYALEVDHA